MGQHSEIVKTADSVRKAVILLNELESKVRKGESLDSNIDDIYALSYIFRVSILDRIQANRWFPYQRINIVFGLFNIKKTTIAGAVEMTIGRLKEIVQLDAEISNSVEEILNKGNLFYELDVTFPMEQRSKL